MASNMSVRTLNGVKIYDLSSGNTMPDWLDDRKKRQLSKSSEYNRRIQIIQDFGFPAASQRLGISPDGKYVFASGTYPPRLRCFQLEELGMKFERYLDAEAVRFKILSDDFRKVVVMRNDRYVEFHASWGRHYQTRIPAFGRDLAFDGVSCDLFLAASGREVYRLNLERGQFSAPLINGAGDTGVNAVELSGTHRLIGCAGEDGILRCFDPRTKSSAPITELDAGQHAAEVLGGPQAGRLSRALTALDFADDGLGVGVGTASGVCLLYDLRAGRPVMHKEHQNEEPIHTLRYVPDADARGQKLVASADGHTVKLWERQSGKALTNVETAATAHDMVIYPGSGMIFVAGEQERIMTYYVPALGPAPRWCHFLDSITEELEEKDNSAVFENYKFITRAELEKLGLGHMVGTPLLRAYMHGFFIDARLHKRVKAVAEPFDYDKWRKQKVRDKIEAKQAQRVVMVSNKPKVNATLHEQLRTGEGMSKKKGVKQAKAGAAALLEDDRFASMFTDDNFQIDPEAKVYGLLNASASAAEKAALAKEAAAVKAKQQLWHDAFDAVGDDGQAAGDDSEDSDMDDGTRDNDEDDEDEDDEEQATATTSAGPRQKGRGKKKKVRMFAAKEGADFNRLDALTRDESSRSGKRARAELRRQRKTLQERMSEVRERERAEEAEQQEVRFKGGVREMTYIPSRKRKEKATDAKAERQKKQRKRGVGALKLISGRRGRGGGGRSRGRGRR